MTPLNDYFINSFQSRFNKVISTNHYHNVSSPNTFNWNICMSTNNVSLNLFKIFDQIWGTCLRNLWNSTSNLFSPLLSSSDTCIRDSYNQAATIFFFSKEAAVRNLWKKYMFKITYVKTKTSFNSFIFLLS